MSTVCKAVVVRHHAAPHVVSRKIVDRFRRRVTALLACVAFFGNGASALAQSALTGANGNLTSTAHTVTATVPHAVNINVAGTRTVVQPGQLLTPAEAAAVNQVLDSGRQSLILGQLGNAIGGKVNVGLDIGTSLANLVVPTKVTALENFSAAPGAALNLSGDLTNTGSFYLYSTASQVTAGSINAANIFNNTGGVISSVVTSTLLGGKSFVHSFDLTLNVANILNNAGTISSSGNLNLNSASVVNSGTVASIGGNINLSSQFASNIVVDNTGGTFQANRGDINVRNASFAGTYNFDLTGGNLLSKNVNIFSGCGTVNVNADNITGVVNIAAGAAHVTASTPNLKLGTMTLGGDPTFYNTSGSITIDQGITTSGADLAIVANKDINASGSSFIVLNTQNGSGTSGAVTMIAGAQFTDSPGGGSQTTFSSAPGGDTSNTLTITGGSSTGGSINLSGDTGGTSINTAGLSSNAGGSVQLVAFAGTAANSGSVIIPSTSITTGGSGGASGGNVTIIAGGTGNGVVNTGLIDTSNGGGSSVGTGEVTIRVATPVIINGPMTIFSGTITGGAFGALTSQSGQVLVGPVVSNAAPVTVATGGNVSLQGQILNPGGNVAILAGGNVTAGAAAAQIDTNDGVSGNGGNVSIVAGADLQPAGSLSSPTADAPDQMFIAGNSTTGGSIDLTSSTANPVINVSTSGGGSGGAVQLMAMANGGTTSSSGAISSNTSKVLILGGGGSGAGNVDITAGKVSGTAISIGDITDASGTFPGGQITITTAAPSLPSGAFLYGPSGGTGGAFGINQLQNASAVVGNLTTVGANVGVQAGNNLSVGNVSNQSIGGSNVNLTASLGTLTFNGGTVDVSGLSGSGSNGGTINVTANKIVNSSGTTAETLNASSDQPGTPDGAGNIFVTSTGAGNSLTIGNAANQIAITANNDSTGGGSSATVQISSGGDLTVNTTGFSIPTPGGSGGTAATIGLAAGTAGQGNLKVNGSLDASGATTTGDGGSITLSSNSSTPFLINSATGANGITGTLTATTTSGQGGSVTVTNTGTGGVTLSSATGINVAPTSGHGGTIDLEAPAGALTLASGVSSLKVDAVDSTSDGSGGTLTLNARSLVFSGGPLLLSANGVGNGDGGAVNLTSSAYTSAGDISIGTGAGQIKISATGGTGPVGLNPPSFGGNGGTVNVTSGHDLTVDPTAITAGALGSNGNGANLSFSVVSQGGGSLTISGPINVSAVNAAHAGSLTVSATTTAPISIDGGLTANGGTGPFNGGSISISNSLGGITFISPLAITANAGTQGFGPGGQGGGSVNINALGAVTAPGGAITVNATGNVNSDYTAGSIAIQASTLNLTGTGAAGNLALNANGSNASGTNFGSGGSITLMTSAATSDLVVGTGAGQISISATGGGTGQDGNGGSVSLTAGRNLTVDPAALNAQPATGTTNGAGEQLSFTAVGTVTTSGAITATGAGTGDGGAITITGHDLSLNGSMNVNTGTAMPANSEAQINLTANLGNITFTTTPNLTANSLTDGQTAGSISVTAGSGTINFQSGTTPSTTATLAANGTGTSSASGGGSVSISANKLNITNGALLLQANGTGTGNGGSVSVTTIDVNSDITIGTGVGQITVSATGGTGGSTPSSAGDGGILTVMSGRGLIVNVSAITLGPLGTNGNGGQLNFQTNGDLTINGALNYAGVGIGNGGQVNLQTGGGNITMDGTLDLDAGATGSTGGTAMVNGNNITLTSALAFSANAPGGSGGSITVPVSNFTAPAGTISATGGGASGTGGTIELDFSNATITGTGPVTLNADAVGSNGTGGNSGGHITIFAGSDLTIGSGNGDFKLSAQGANNAGTGNDGGRINLTANNLIIDTTALKAAPQSDGHGAFFSLSAFGDQLTINGAMDASGNLSGAGGNINITNLGQSTVVTINGALHANGGSSGGDAGNILIDNSNGVGGVNFPNGINITADGLSTGSSGGQITIATGAGSITSLGNTAGVISANTNGAPSNNAQISINSESGGGVISLSSNLSINAQATNAAGITGGSITVVMTQLTGAGNLVLNANVTDASGGSGGIVLVSTIGGTGVGDLTIGGGAGQVQINVQGGSAPGSTASGGNVTVNAGGNLTVADTTKLVFNPQSGTGGNGGSIALNAGQIGAGALLIKGALDASGDGSGPGGTITLTESSNTPFIVNGGNTVTNGTFGPITTGGFGNITVTSFGGTSGGITVKDPVTALNISSTGFGTSTISLNAGVGHLVIDTTLSSTLSADTTSGPANNLSLQGADITVTGTSGNPLTLSASAGDLASPGGSITVITTNPFSPAANLTIGNAAGDLIISATGAGFGQPSAVVTVQAAGNLTVNTAQLTTTPVANTGSDGPNITLSAGDTLHAGNLVVNGALNADADQTATFAGSGGILTLISNSTTTFNIGGGGLNGTSTGISANSGQAAGNAGTITVINYGSGGITLPALSNISLIAGNSGGTLNLISPNGPLNLTVASGDNTLSVNAGAFSGLGGTMTLIGSQINLSGSSGFPLLLKADGNIGNFAGTINITTTSNTGDITIGSNAIAVEVLDDPAGGINGGSINISAGGNLSVDPTRISSGTGIDGNGISLRFTAGAVPGSSGSLTITGPLDASGANGQSAGGIFLATNGTGSITLGGNLTADGGAGMISVLAGSNSSTVNAGGIDETAATLISTEGGAGSININAGRGTLSFGSSPTIIQADAGSFGPAGTINVQGYVINAGAHLTISASGSPGSFDFTGGQVTLAATGPNGNISIAPLSGPAGTIDIATPGGSASGNDGNAGTITITAGGALTVDPAGLNTQILGPDGGNGATLNFTAGTQGGGSLTINGTLDVSGLGDSFGGQAGSITLVNAGSGALTVNGNIIAISESFFSFGFPPNITVQNTGTGDVVLGTGTSLVSNAIQQGFNTGNIVITAAVGKVTLQNGMFIDASSANTYTFGNGGSVTLQGSDLIFAGASLLPVVIAANGSGSQGNGGFGGSISVQTTAPTSNLTVGSLASQMELLATGESTGFTNGAVTVQSGGNLTIDPTAIIAGGAVPDVNLGSTAPNFSFAAGGPGGSANPGTLVITGPLQSVGANGSFDGPGSITLAMNSSTPFDIGTAGTNGIGGGITVNSNGGSIFVQNLGPGGIVIDAPTLLVNTTSAGFSNTSLDTNGPIIFTTGGTLLVTGPQGGGSINLHSSTLTVASGTLVLDASSENQAGGQINIGLTNPTVAGNLSIGSGAGQVSINATGGTIGSTLFTGGGSVFINVAAALTVDPSALNVGTLSTTGSGANLIFTAGNNGTGSMTITGPLNVDAAGGVTATGGSAELNSNSNVALNIQGISANGAAGGSISISARGGLNASGNLTANGFTGTGGDIGINTRNSTVNFTSASTISANGGGVSSGSGGGGSIMINAGKITTTAGVLTMSANGGIGDSGGSINVQTNSGLAIGGTGDLSLSATGGSAGSLTGDGGTLSVAALDGNVNITPGNAFNAAPLGANGNGATISIAAGGTFPGNVAVSSSLNANGVGTGAGGSIEITETAKTAFSVGAAKTAPANGVNGALSANAGSAGGNGGSISITNNGSGGITILKPAKSTSPQNLTVTAGTGNGGDISLIANGGPVAGNVTLPKGTFAVNGVNGGQFTVQANQLILAGATTFSANGSGFGSGGTVTLTTIQSLKGGPLSLLANGGGNGNGGTVSLTTTGTNANIIIGKKSGDEIVSATGGTAAAAATKKTPAVIGQSGAGGIVTISAGSNLTIAPAQLTAGPLFDGNGAQLTFTGGAVSGTGNVLVTGALSANGLGSGNGGDISITSNGTAPFNIGSTTLATTKTNGTTGIITAEAGPTGTNGITFCCSFGSISVSNNGTGGISLTNLSNINVNAPAGSAGSVSLTALNGPISLAGGTWSENGGTGNANGGGISLSAQRFVFVAPASKTTPPPVVVTLSANGTGTGNGGGISITATNVTNGDITIGTANGNFVISATGGSAGSDSGSAGSVFLNAAHNLTVNTAQLTAVPLGNNGLGATIGLFAGTNGSGSLSVIGSLNANASAIGSGIGGQIRIVGSTNTPISFTGTGATDIGADCGPLAIGFGGLDQLIVIQNNDVGGISFANGVNIHSNANFGQPGTITVDAAGGFANSIQAAGPLTFASGGTISASTQNGNFGTGAGQITVRGSTISAGTGVLQIAANTTVQGIGGTVSVVTTDRNGTLTIGGTAGDIAISARGALPAVGFANGSVTVVAGGNLTVATSSLNVGGSGSGGAIDLEAGRPAYLLGTTAAAPGSGNLVINGSIDVSATGSSSAGGSVMLASTSSSAFTVGAGGTPTNGISGTISANGGMQNGFTSGGSISIINHGNGGITVADPASISLVSPTGLGGTLTLNAAPDGPGPNSSPGVLTIGSGVLSVDSSDQGPNTNQSFFGSSGGGTISLIGLALIVSPLSGNGNLVLSANGGANSFGGTISVTTYSAASDIQVGTGSGQLTVSAAAGPNISDNAFAGGGFISISSGRNLSIDVTALNANPIQFNYAGQTFGQPFTDVTGQGATLSFTAGIATAGNLTISGTLSASASGSQFGSSAGGTINLISNSPFAFNVGSALTNGIGGSVNAFAGGMNATGGTVLIQNKGAGGITVGNPSDINVAATGGFNGFAFVGGGSISLIAANNPNASVASGPLVIGSGTLSADSGDVGQSTPGGKITLVGTTITVTGLGNLTLSANGAEGANGGTIIVNATDNGAALSIGGAPGDLAVSATGGTPGAFLRSSGGQVQINSGGNLTVDANFLSVGTVGPQGSGGLLVLSASTPGNPLRGMGNIGITGNLSLFGIGGDSGGQVTINADSAEPFIVGPGATTNGITGTISVDSGTGDSSAAGFISIDNFGGGGIIVQNTSNLSLVTNGSGGTAQGGTLDLGQNTPGVIQLAGGTLAVNSTSPFNFGRDQINIGSRQSIVDVTGNLLVSANGTAGTGNGGSITITAAQLNVAGGVSGGVLTLQANGSGSGTGGSITILETGHGDLTIDGTQNGTIAISATGGGQGNDADFQPFSGGSVCVNAAGNLTVNNPATSMNVAALGVNGNGGFVQLLAGAFGSTGALIINGSLDVSGSGDGAPGNIDLSSSSINAFTVGTASPTNGITGSLSANAGVTNGCCAGGSIQIVNTLGGITINSTNNVSVAAGLGFGGRITLNAAGAVTLPSGTISLDAAGTNAADGGGFSVIGSAINITGGNLLVSANGVAGGSGGNVSLGTTGTTALADINIGTGSGQIAISATGGDVSVFSTANSRSGSIDVNSGSDLNVSSAAINGGTAGFSANALSGNGAFIILSAHGNLVVTGSLNASGLGIGQGGVLALSSFSSSPFTVGATTPTNGISGVLTANAGTFSGNGGDIGINNLGTGGITIASTGSLSAAATSGIGGAITLTTQNAIVPAGSTPAALAPLTITSKSAGVFNVSGAGGNFNGGNIDIEVGSLALTGGLTLTANGAGSGNGGRVTVLASQGSLTIGPGAKKVAINATGGKANTLQGDGGTVTVSAGSNLAVTASAIKAGPLGQSGDGATIDLTAGLLGKGNLAVKGSLSANGVGQGSGGTLALVSNSSTVFSVGAGGPNSSGKLSANSGSVYTTGIESAGDIIVINQGSGGVKLASLASVSATAASGSGGTIDLGDSANTPSGFVQSGFGPLSVPGGGKLSANASPFTSTFDPSGGTLMLGGSTLTISGKSALILSANASTNGIGGPGGSIIVAVTTGSLTLGSGAGQVTINDVGTSFGQSAPSGTVSISTGNSLTVNTSNLNVAPLLANSNGPNLSFIAGTAGAGNLTITGTGATPAPLSSSAVGLGTAGNITLAASGVLSVGTTGTVVNVTANSGLIPVGSFAPIISITNNGTNPATESTQILGNVSANTTSAIAGTISITGTVPVSFGTTTAASSVSANVTRGDFDGGSISVQGASLTNNNATSPVAFSANGSGDGNAGRVSIIVTGATSDLNVGTTGTNPIAISTLGRGYLFPGQNNTFITNGVTLSAGRNLTVNVGSLQVGPQGDNGNGGNVSLTAGTQTAGNLSVTGGTLDVSGKGVGNGGSIQIFENGSQTLTIGAGGINGTNNLVAKAGSAFGAGGMILITDATTQGISVSSGAITATATQGNGGTIALIAGVPSNNIAGPVTVVGGDELNANAVGGGNGGVIGVWGSALTVSGAGVFTLAANGAGNGNGGSVNVTLTGTTADIQMSGTAGGSIAVQANGGSVGGTAGDAGSVWIAPGRNLTVLDAGGLSAGPLGLNGSGSGATASPTMVGGLAQPNGITLIAGNNGPSAIASIAFSSSLNADGVGLGNGGNISLQMRTFLGAAFDIGTAGSNGVTGLTANAGSSGGNGGSISVVNNGNAGITVDNTLDISASASLAGGNGGAIILNAQSGPLTFTAGTSLDVSGVSGNAAGGQIQLIFGSLSSVGGPMTLTANSAASGSGNAGYVNIQSTQALTIDSTTFANISTLGSGNTALGANSGIAISSGRNLTIDTTVLTFGPQVGQSGNGAVLAFTAGNGGPGDLAINNLLDVSGCCDGNGGSVSLSSHDTSNPFVIGASTPSNGVPGVVGLGGGAMGSGGSLSVFASGGGIQVTDTQDIVVLSNGGSGGSIALNTTGAVTITTTALDNTIDVSTSVFNGSGSQSGGTVTIHGTSLVISGPSLAINAGGIDQGGNVSITTTATSPNGDLTLGSAAGQLTINAGASGGSGLTTGGSVSVVAGGNLTVGSGTIVVGTTSGTADGGSLTLSAGGNLSVTGPLDVSGFSSGNGGSITLVSNSTTPFNIGGGGANGTTGAVTANSGALGGSGGTIVVQNFGTGGITLSAINDVSASALIQPLFSSFAGGHITLDAAAGATGGALTMPSGTISVDGSTGTTNFDGVLTVNGGSIYLRGTQLVEPSGVLTLSANGAAGGGAITVITTGSGANLTVGGGANGSIDISAVGGSFFPFIQQATAGGNVTISAGGALTVATNALNVNGIGTNVVNGPQITLAAGTAGAAALTITGTLHADSVGPGTPGSISITYNDASNPFTEGVAVTHSGITGNLTANSIGGAAGSITIVNSAAAATNVVASGTISAVSTPTTITASFLPPPTPSAGTINLNGGSNAVIESGAGNLAGIVEATGSSITINSTAKTTTMQLGDMTASSGNLSVTIAAGLLQVVADSTLSATAGNLILNEKGKGSIAVGANATINAVHSTATNGTVTLAVGPVPTKATGGNVPPANVIVNATPPGNAFFSTTSTVLASPPANVVTPNGRNIQFSGGAKTITLAGNDAFTAISGHDASNDDVIVDTDQDADVDDTELANR